MTKMTDDRRRQVATLIQWGCQVDNARSRLRAIPRHPLATASGVAKKFGRIGPSFQIGIDLWVGREQEHLLIFKGHQKTTLNEKAIHDIDEGEM